jgi:hypothetical protein
MRRKHRFVRTDSGVRSNKCIGRFPDDEKKLMMLREYGAPSRSYTGQRYLYTIPIQRVTEAAKKALDWDM